MKDESRPLGGINADFAGPSPASESNRRKRHPWGAFAPQPPGFHRDMWENGSASLYPRIARLGDLRSPSCTVERFFAGMEEGMDDEDLHLSLIHI